MQETTNFKFLQPDGTDKVLVSNLNENMIKLDEILADIYSKLPTPPQPVTIKPTDWLDAGDGSFLYTSPGANLGLELGKLVKFTVTKDGSSFTYISQEPVVDGADLGEAYPAGSKVSYETSLTELADGGMDATVVDSVLFDSQSGTLTIGDGFIVVLSGGNPPSADLSILPANKLTSVVSLNPADFRMSSDDSSFFQYFGTGELHLTVDTPYAVSFNKDSDTYTIGTMSIDGGLIGASGHPALSIRYTGTWERLSDVLSRFELIDGIISTTAVSGDGYIAFITPKQTIQDVRTAFDTIVISSIND